MVVDSENVSDGNVGNCVPTTPEWLNEDYFKDVLDKEYGKYKIEKFSVANALPKGENYASMMNRVGIDLKLEDGTTTTVSYIVKSMLDAKVSASFLTDISLFPKEMEMYEKIIAQFDELLNAVGVDVKIGADCIKCRRDPLVIVLEDLKVKGYENINRLNGMDLKHMEATLERLAMFHAASARLYELYGPYSDHFNKGLFPPEIHAVMEKLLDDFWPIMEECIHKWGGCEKYVDRMRDMVSRFCKLIQDAETLNPNEFNVLNHGDMWCNNIMFKHGENGEIEDLKFVDLQLCKWGSPVLDLQYLIISSCSFDIRLEKFDYFIKYYHQHLVENLEKLKFSGTFPKLLDFHVQILKRGYFGFNVMFGTLSAVLLDPNEKADMEIFFQDTQDANDFKRQIYMTPRYVKTVKSLLEFFDNKGILDL